MSEQFCTLCETGTANVELNIRTCQSRYSKTSFLQLLQQTTQQTFSLQHYEICRSCYLLINDLDKFRVKVENISNILNNYLRKYWPESQIQPAEPERIISVPEECLLSKERKFSTQPLEPNSMKNKENTDETRTKLLIKTETDVKEYKCDICSKSWKNMSQLKTHQISHGERTFICDICGQSYKRKANLLVHISMHNGVNPFTCTYCNKVFTQKIALKRHIPVHTGELPFQCDLCGKRFPYHTSLNIHKLCHSGKKTHKCDICGLGLISTSHLNRHKRIHSGEKKHVCSICGKAFAERYNLTKHAQLHIIKSP